MKLLLCSAVLTAGLVVIVGVHNASAQIENALEFTTSFPFTIGNTTVPPGTYTLAAMEDDPQVLELKGSRTSVLFVTESAQSTEPQSKSEVVFNRYGDRLVLKKVWVEGSEIGYVAEPSVGERHLSKLSPSSTESHLAARKTATSSK